MAINGNPLPSADAAGYPPGIAPAAPTAGGCPDVHHDIARDIGQQVELMIMEAKNNSESKVGKELQKVKAKMESMGEKIKAITERVSRLEPAAAGLLKADLQKSIEKLEEMWEGEVGTLKHELWQTIQAHNHNADLLKHHKDAIDQIQGQISDHDPNPELEHVQAQLMQVDKIMQRERTKEAQMEQLLQRLAIVQQQLGTGAVGPWAAGNPSAAFASPSATPAAQAANKRAQRKVAKSKPAAKAPPSTQTSSQLGGLRAEAPEFVPTWTES